MVAFQKYGHDISLHIAVIITKIKRKKPKRWLKYINIDFNPSIYKTIDACY